MVKWEYGFHSFDAYAPTEPWTLATEMGKDGWELVGTTAVVDGWITYLFKRPIDPEAAIDLKARVSVFGRQLGAYRENLHRQQASYSGEWYQGLAAGLDWVGARMHELGLYAPDGGEQ